MVYRVLVDKADSSGDGSAVFVDASLAETEVEKAADRPDATTSGSDEWHSGWQFFVLISCSVFVYHIVSHSFHFILLRL